MKCLGLYRAGAAAIVFAVSLLLVSISSLAHAADYSWDGGAADENWSSTNNWNPDSGVGGPGTNDTVTFDSTSNAVPGTKTSEVDGDFIITNLVVTAQSGNAHGINVPSGNSLTILNTLKIGELTTTAHLWLLGEGTVSVPTLTVGSGTGTAGAGTLDLSSSSNTLSVGTLNVGLGAGTTGDQGAGLGLLKGLGAAAPMTVSPDTVVVGRGTLDIGAQGRLVVSNSLTIGQHTYKAAVGAVTVASGGRLDVGTSGARASLILGAKTAPTGTSYGVLAPTAGSTNTFYLAELEIGDSTYGQGTLDLSAGHNTLDVDATEVRIGVSGIKTGYMSCGYGSGSATIDADTFNLGRGTVDLGPTASVTVTNALKVDYNSDSLTAGIGVLQLTGGTLTVGTPAARAQVDIGRSFGNSGRDAEGFVQAASGSQVELYASALTIAQRDTNSGGGGIGNHRGDGTLDLSALTLVTNTPAAGEGLLDATTVNIGSGPYGSSSGLMELGSGEATIGTLNIGGSVAARAGRLNLTQTHLIVTNILNVSSAGGTLYEEIGETSSGIVLLNSNTNDHTINNVELHFKEMPLTTELRAFQIAGSNVAWLEALTNAGSISMIHDGMPESYPFGVYYDAGADKTWLGVNWDVSAPVIDNLPGASEISGRSARLNGNLLAGTAPTTVYAYWGTTDGLDDPNNWDHTTNWVVSATPPVAVWTNVTVSQYDTVYYYNLYAENASGSMWAAVPTPTWMTDFDVSDAPSNLTALAISDLQIDLTWTDNSALETGFRIDRSTNATEWVVDGSVGADEEAYSVTGLEIGRLYYFRVYATNNTHISDYAQVSQSTVSYVPAENYTWDNDAGDQLWSTAVNWDPTAAPNNPDGLDTVTFDATSNAVPGTKTSEVDADFTVTNLVVTAQSGNAQGLEVPASNTLSILNTLSVGDESQTAHLWLLGEGTVSVPTLRVGRGVSGGYGTLDLSASSNELAAAAVEIGVKSGGSGDYAGGRGLLKGLGAAAPMTLSPDTVLVGWGTLDVGAHGRLQVAQSLTLGAHEYKGSPVGAITLASGGRLDVGTPGARAALNVGVKTGATGTSYGVLAPTEGSTNTFYLDDLQIADSGYAVGTLDLSAGHNTLDVDATEVRIGVSGTKTGYMSCGYDLGSATIDADTFNLGRGTVDLGPTASVTVTNALKVDYNADAVSSGIGVLQLNGGTLTVGTPAARAQVDIGRSFGSTGRDAEGVVTASSGSKVALYAGTLTIARRDTNSSGGLGNHRGDGALDLGALTLVTNTPSTGQGLLDATTVNLGNTPYGGSAGLMKLGPGEVTIGTLNIGGNAATRTGSLVTSNTVVTVNSALNIDVGGAVSSIVERTSSGLHLLATNAAAHTLTNICLVFTADPLGSELWGLRVDGLHADEFRSLVSSNAITIKREGIDASYLIDVYTDTDESAPGGYTFVGVATGEDPRIKNLPATGIGTTSATLNGQLTSTGAATTVVHVYWGDTDMGQTTTGWDGWMNLSQQSVGDVTHDLQSLSPDTMYYYRFWASNAYSEGVWAFPAESFVTAFSAAEAPTGLVAVANGANTVNLSWSDNSKWETGFIVERSLDGNSWLQVALAPEDSTNYSDTFLLPDTLYYYRVAGTNMSGDVSDYSNVASDQTDAAPTASADAYTWDNGEAGDLTWRGSRNWDPDAYSPNPDYLDSVTFANTGTSTPGLETSTVAADETVETLTVDNTTGAHTLGIESNCTLAVLGETRVAYGVGGSSLTVQNRGTFVTDGLRVGGNTANRAGMLVLDKSTIVVTNAAIIGTYGTVSNRVRELGGSGLYLKNPVAGQHTIRNMHLVFPDSGIAPPQNEHVMWGLRMDGDNRAYFNSLTNSGAVTWDLSAVPAWYESFFGVYYNAELDVTLMGIDFPEMPPGVLIWIR